ncbi:hypothetical protein CU098_002311, partial [Rhizopus stolonifer]
TEQEMSTLPSLAKEDHIIPVEDVIWVPADKHPQIAPNEFANFIKTHGANMPTKRSLSLHRRNSILSQSVEQDEEEQEETLSLSEKKRIFLEKVMEDGQLKDSQVFDRNSVSTDDSRIIAPRTDKSLLRRSAFSARGRNRKSRSDLQRRSLSQRSPSHEDKTSIKSNKTNTSWDKSVGISLFDQPVNMSEWIDLGSASLESKDSQRGILSRVHDAESQLLSQQQQQEKEEPPPKRPAIIRSESVIKPEKRTSWFGGLFADKKTKKAENPLSGLASLFTRSLSLKNINNTPKKRSSKLALLPPPLAEHTFFNPSRLPLHVERAIYRLSHMKLADPRRPLRQQVLISNLMFWYLSIQQTTDYQEQRVETESPPIPDTHQKKNKIRFKKPKPNPTVQFNLPVIPSHQTVPDDDEDNVPLFTYISS